MSTYAPPAQSVHGPHRLIGPMLMVVLVALPLSWWLPMFTTQTLLFFEHKVSIVVAIATLFETDLFLCSVVVLFSIVAPVLKNAAFIYVWYRVPNSHALRWVSRLTLLGKLSMAEIFLVALAIVGIKGVALQQVYVDFGLYFFSLVILTSLVLSLWAIANLENRFPRAASEASAAAGGGGDEAP
jgi:uncharacterized paraquat-inducible protein A